MIQRNCIFDLNKGKTIDIVYINHKSVLRNAYAILLISENAYVVHYLVTARLHFTQIYIKYEYVRLLHQFTKILICIQTYVTLINNKKRYQTGVKVGDCTLCSCLQSGTPIQQTIKVFLFAYTLRHSMGTKETFQKHCTALVNCINEQIYWTFTFWRWFVVYTNKPHVVSKYNYNNRGEKVAQCNIWQALNILAYLV